MEDRLNKANIKAAEATVLREKAQAALLLVDAGYDPEDVLDAVGLPSMGVHSYRN
jgi:hypothetical protein